ncbi:MAG: TatD family hydrolase [Candidatus Micrarchaeota archaeon]
MRLVDSHCHLVNMKKGYKPTEGVLPVTVGYSHSTNVKTVAIAKELGIPFVLGIAPQTAMKSGLGSLDEWVDFIRKNPPNAVGEIGLDYHWAENEQHIENEKAVFRRMLSLADELQKPVVIHARKATHDVLDFLQLRQEEKPFMMHFFSGTLAEAQRAVGMGGLISITPLHSKSRRTIIKSLDLEHMVVETDAPYVGRTPEAVKDAVDYICEVKSLDFDIVAKKTAENSLRFFGVKGPRR